MKKGAAPKSFRLSQDGALLLRLVSERLGIGQTAVLEVAIRDLASARGLVVIRGAEPLSIEQAQGRRRRTTR